MVRVAWLGTMLGCLLVACGYESEPAFGASDADAGPGGSSGSSGSSGAVLPSCGVGTEARCKDGAACSTARDCESASCVQGTCASATTTDGVKNGPETGIDCGGPAAPKCAAQGTCLVATDCIDGVCAAGVCQAASPTDAVQNGLETDVDCGGGVAPACGFGKSCQASTDCATAACDYQQKCVQYPSCVAHEGGDTCGVGEVDEAGREHQSCCTEIELPTGTKVDKYLVTAGRMRAFVEHTGGDVAGWIAAHKPEWWDAEYGVDAVVLPTTLDELYLEMSHVGQSAGCFIPAGAGTGGGVRTYWIPEAASVQYGSGVQAYPQQVLDTKALNCVRRYMLAALCAFDGKRLPKQAELQEAWGGTGRKYPWGAAAYTPELAIHRRSYVYPAPIPGTQDQAYHMAPPGRRPLGYGPLGHADMAGLLLEHAAGGPSISKGSYENHAIGTNAAPIAGYAITRKYAAIGGRCARD